MLKLGENLKKFRSQRELTQEQLADVLGVSAQAVSRRENQTTYPDITLLPTIASYFEITLDELMGMEYLKSEEMLKELIEQLDENGSKGLIYENILLLREAVKTYPANYQLQFRLVNKTYYDIHEMMKNYDFTDCRELYDKMQWDRYDAIRDDKRFIAVLEEIGKYF